MREGADPLTLIAAAKRYHDDPRVLQGYGKHPATWLNAKCWLDEEGPASTQQGNGYGPRPSTTDRACAEAQAVKDQLRGWQT
jgi:hypothetical protein